MIFDVSTPKGGTVTVEVKPHGTLSTETDFDAINAQYCEKLLANGWRVLAHVVKGEVEPYRFSNVTQAKAKAALFRDAWVTISRPFYVRFPDDA